MFASSLNFAELEAEKNMSSGKLSLFRMLGGLVHRFLQFGSELCILVKFGSVWFSFHQIILSLVKGSI